MIESNNPEIPRIQVIRRQSPFGGPLVTEEVMPVLPSSGRTCVLLSVENHADDGQNFQAVPSLSLLRLLFVSKKNRHHQTALHFVL